MELLVKGAAEALGIRLDERQIGLFHRYYLELVDWSKRINLTTVTGREEVQTRHFLDSLSVSAVLPPDVRSGGVRLLDLGSGAGLPGIPLKIVFPSVNLTLMDATARKTAFLSHVTQVLGLDGVEVCTGRAESLAHDPGLRESYDVVVSRAVARLPVLAELTLPFCRLGGTVVAQKGTGAAAEVREAAEAIEAMGGELGLIRETELGGQDGAGTLVVLEKKRPTPDRYPRRPGIPAKRPIGATGPRPR